jgi:hypothetical protein
MAVSAMLRTTRVDVVPGGAARCHVLIRNNSAVVDQFAFTVRGDVAGWTEVKPARVNLMPNQEVTVELTFAPPRSPEVLAGDHPFALQVASREDPGGSVVQEGVVTLEPFTEVDAAIVPVTSTGRRKGKHTLAVDNLGNQAHGVEVIATDPDSRLVFRVRPHAPKLEPGTATFVRVVARPKKYFWKGPNRVLPFVVKVIVPDGDPIETDAALDQSPLIPRRFLWLFSILFAVLLVLVIIVAALLRQRPQSIAGPAPTAGPTTATTTTTASATSSSAPSSPSAPPSSSAGAGDGGGNGNGDGDGDGSPVTTTFTIRAQAFPGVGGGPQLFSYVVPPGPRHRVTSVVLRNPGADVGQLQLRHGERVLGTLDLADIDGEGLTFEPDEPPLVAPGELVTIAVSCGNGTEPCTPAGVFTSALVR